MIIDSTILYNELDMLEFRLMELYSTVDWFVITEARRSFRGNEKPLFFEEHKERFNRYQDKIIHLIIDDFPSYKSPWQREFFQRQYFIDKLSFNHNDIIIIADVDEVPDSQVIANIKRDGLKEPIRLKQHFYHYNICTKRTENWNFSYAIEYYNLLSLLDNGETINKLRFDRNRLNFQLVKCGWHLSFFGDENYVVDKLKNYSHSEYSKFDFVDPKRVKRLMREGKDILGKRLHQFPIFNIDVNDNDYLPQHYQYLLDTFCKL